MSQSVELRGVTKRFGDTVAVDDIDLEIGQGEFFTLLGPSGCGKTTTLRMVAGFEQPDTGSIRIDGADVAGLPPHKRPTNTVFQSYALFPHLSVGDNVAFGLRRKGVSKAEAERRVDEELRRVGLHAAKNRRPSQLSGGQQQRVACARALVTRPEVVFADEPTGNLDSRSGAEVLGFLRRSVRESGQTIVMVTHDPVAASYADRVVFLGDGQIVDELQDPTAESVLDTMKRLDSTTLLDPAGVA